VINMYSMTQPSRSSKFTVLKKQLASQRDELRARLGERHKSVIVEREPDDEMAAACENISKDMLIRTLERERRTLDEIELALASMKSGEYGSCGACGAKIPDARLRALPWTRFCVRCAA
jgi:RNA polymerase-binding transcription factor